MVSISFAFTSIVSQSVLSRLIHNTIATYIQQQQSHSTTNASGSCPNGKHRVKIPRGSTWGLYVYNDLYYAMLRYTLVFV